MAPEQEPNWQSIGALPLLASMIDGQLEHSQQQYDTLLEAEDRPYVLDDATLARVQHVFGDTAADMWLYDEQLRRWSQHGLTAAQTREVERLRRQVARLHEVVDQILALAARLKHHTIDTLLAKSDLEVGLEWFLRSRDS